MEPKWNVKSHVTVTFSVTSAVLMEPKWNVKEGRCVQTQQPMFVLMEPKWNVKADVDLFHHTLEAGINGTKVECKERDEDM